MYGHYGIEAFEHTIKYAKSQGLIVIEDGKRNDIGNTAAAYSSSHLGEVELLNNSNNTIFDVDYLTVSPYLGRESIEPFIKDAEKYNKGIFILVKTSNPNSGDIQDKTILDGITISELIAKYVNDQSCRLIGNKYGYSSLGAVVGATYPVHAKQLRRIMPNSIFLVPGYGAQGANTESILNCFNDDGLGAIVNSSRNILYSYENIISSEDCDISTFKNSVRNSCEEMKEQIYYSLKQNKPQIKY